MIEKIEYLVDDIQELVLFPLLEHFSYEPIIEYLDFTILGLRKETPIYGKKGVKQSSSYFLNEIEAVRKTFLYTPEGVWISIFWFDNNSDVGIEKTFFKPLNKVEIYTINKKNRSRTISYLQAASVGTPIEIYVNLLLKHYKNEIDLFIYGDTLDFKIAIENESIPEYLNYLNIIIEGPSIKYPQGKTVKDSILEQII